MTSPSKKRAEKSNTSENDENRSKKKRKTEAPIPPPPPLPSAPSHRRPYRRAFSSWHDSIEKGQSGLQSLASDALRLKSILSDGSHAWISSTDTPRCTLEHFAQEVYRCHMGGNTGGFGGVEFWAEFGAAGDDQSSARKESKEFRFHKKNAFDDKPAEDEVKKTSIKTTKDAVLEKNGKDIEEHHDKDPDGSVHDPRWDNQKKWESESFSFPAVSTVTYLSGRNLTLALTLTLTLNLNLNLTLAY